MSINLVCISFSQSSSKGFPYLTKITITKQLAISHDNMPKISKILAAMSNRSLVFSSVIPVCYEIDVNIKVMKFIEVAARNDPTCALMRRSFETMPELARVLVNFLIRFKEKQRAVTK